MEIDISVLSYEIILHMSQIVLCYGNGNRYKILHITQYIFKIFGFHLKVRMYQLQT